MILEAAQIAEVKALQTFPTVCESIQDMSCQVLKNVLAKGSKCLGIAPSVPDACGSTTPRKP